MSDYIDNQIKIFAQIEKLFDSTRKHLKEIELELKTDFEEILKLFSDDYKLVAITNTSVNPSEYYHLKSRVKTTLSLKEKLLRKNLGLSISLNNSLTTENFDVKHEDIKNSLFLLDDIIGLRIVTELKADCIRVHKLINDKNLFFKDRDIIFNLEELENQPEKMKNGLPIYRIKGVYKTKYGFELQIKSKIDEAWGDMDHSIFYKDYAVSPIKNTVQVTMNNVGMLLDKIEELLLGLRDSENYYKEKKEEIEFLKNLSDNVFIEIKKKLGDNYELGKIASTLKFLKHKTKVKVKDSKVLGLKYNFLEFEVNNVYNINYIKHRNANFELLITEALYFYWAQKAGTVTELNSENYEGNLEQYIDYLSENMSINSSNLGTINITKLFVKKIFAEFSEEFNKTSIFLNPKLIFDIQIISTIFKEVFQEIKENEEFEFINLEFETKLKNIYIKSYLSFINITEIVEIENILQETYEFESLGKIVFDINQVFFKAIDSYKLNDEKEKLEEAKFLKKLSEKVLKLVRNTENGQQ